jgi:hypothetical protein
LPFSRVCNDDDKNLVVTRDGGITIGKIYDSVYNKPSIAGVYSAYINQGSTAGSVADGYGVTNASNLSIMQFDFGTLQATRSTLTISAFSMSFNVFAGSQAEYMPSSFMVSINIGNTDISGNILGNSVNFAFTIVSPVQTGYNTYTLPTNVNQIISNYCSTASSTLNLNLTVKAPPAPAGEAYTIYLTSFNVVGILDAYDAAALSPTVTALNLNQA